MRTDSRAIFPDLAAELLRRGNRVRFRAAGASMQPTIEDGELITVAPVAPESVKRGEILRYQHERGVVAHRVGGRVSETVPLREGACPREHYLRRADASVSSADPSQRE